MPPLSVDACADAIALALVRHYVTFYWSSARAGVRRRASRISSASSTLWRLRLHLLLQSPPTAVISFAPPGGADGSGAVARCAQRLLRELPLPPCLTDCTSAVVAPAPLGEGRRSVISQTCGARASALAAGFASLQLAL